MITMITAKLRNLRIAPRKVRLVAALVRGKSAEEAAAILNFAAKRAVSPILKLLNSALADAKNNFQIDSANLYISRITVDEGPKLKRWRARARGSAYTILKRTSSVNLVLNEIVRGASKKAAAAEGGEPRSALAGREKVQAQEKPKPVIAIKKPAFSGAVKRIFRRKAV